MTQKITEIILSKQIADNIQATSNNYRQCLILLFLFNLLLHSTLASAREPTLLYVSSEKGQLASACTKDLPCKEISQALRSVVPGDVIIVQEGNYKGFRIENFHGTPDRPLSIIGKGDVMISLNKDLPDQRDNIQISMSDWIKLNNLNSSHANRAGIRVDQSHNISISNSTFADNQVWGIFANHVNDIVIENNTCSGSKEQHGIYISNSGDRPIIRKNKIFKNAASGIQLNADFSTGGGREVNGDGIITGAHIEKNLIYDNGEKGGAAINLDGVHDSFITNNVLFNNHAAGIAAFQQDAAQGPKNLLIAHNTIDMPHKSRWAIIIKKVVKNIKIVNNIIMHQDANKGGLMIGEKECTHFWDCNGLFEDNEAIKEIFSDYNIFGDYANIVTLNSGVTTMDLRKWQSKGQDIHSEMSTLNDLFLSAADRDYRFSRVSFAIDRGMDLDLIKDDFEDNVRPFGNSCDIGAFEDYFGKK